VNGWRVAEFKLALPPLTSVSARALPRAFSWRVIARHCQRVRAVLILLRRFILTAIALNRLTAADIRQRLRATARIWSARCCAPLSARSRCPYFIAPFHIDGR